MANDRHQLAEMTADSNRGWLSNILAEEGEWSGLSLWQLGSWAIAAIGALVVAFLAIHSPIRKQQESANDSARQSQQIQRIARESQTENQAEAQQVSSAIDTLNADRDRFYTRITLVEQGLDSVTGSVTRQPLAPSLVMSSAVQPFNLFASPPTMISPSFPAPASEPASSPSSSVPEAVVTAAPVEQKTAAFANTSAMESSPIPVVNEASEAPASKPVEMPMPPVVALTQEKASGNSDVASLPKATEAAMASSKEEAVVQRTEFGVDLGGANSVEGLRALWQGVVKSNALQISSLRPIIAIKERRNGLMQLRLIAGPLNDATAAAKLCASLAESNRSCETALFDGQRLTLKTTVEDTIASSPPPPAHKRSVTRRAQAEETPAPPPPPATPLGLFGLN